MSEQRSRREFLRTAAVTGAGLWMANKSWAADTKSTRIIGANDRINIACIGVGGKGGSDSQNASHFGNIAAICDVDDNTLGRAAKRWPDAKKYNDYRQMLKEMSKDIDLVTVSIPDHQHAHATALAITLGKAVYCQKPMTHSIWEARRIGELARAHKVATQMGNQGTAGKSLRANAYAMRAGKLGNVTEVHVWTNRPIWPQGISRPPAATPPDNLHWDLWLGPATPRPYAKLVNEKGEVQDRSPYHDFNWRGWWDFGTGALGDMACHTANLPYMAFDLRYPTSVVATTSGNNKDSYPSSSKITFEFPAIKTDTFSRGPVTMYWYDGHNLPPAEVITNGKFPLTDFVNDGKLSDSGSLIIGDKGVLYTPDDYGGGGHFVGGVDVTVGDYPQAPEEGGEMGHWSELIRAVRSGDPLDPKNRAMSNFPDYAGPLTETILLGNLAVWAEGKKIEWDAKKLRAKNAPEVAEIIKPKYRPGYAIA
jgi:predicted dehydrogenase